MEAAMRETSFTETLKTYVNQRGYTFGQLARLTGLPKRTIANWLEGVVIRPRDWRDLVRLAAGLHLDETDATQLLQAAQYPGVAQLLAQVTSDADCQLLAPWAEAVQRRLDQCPFQVIADLPHFVGREHEIEILRNALLNSQSNNLCSLHGMAGAGKTALATHLTYQLRAYFPDGVLWARLDKADTLSILSSFARAYRVDITDYKDIESRSRVVRELLAHKRALVVLDNVETSEQVEPLLPPSGHCVVLITTRRHDLAVTRGAQRFEIGPFTRSEEAFDLFARLLGSEQAQRERESLIEIADLLGHLPLALDITASRMAYEPGWSAAEFLSRLRREKNRLSELVYENQSVRLSFNISYQKLSPDHQHVFHALGVFGGEDFSLDAAATITERECETAADDMRSLYALSLIQVGRPGRYRLHPLLRDLALEGQSNDASRRRMVAFFVRYAESQREVYDALDLEISNLLAALQVAFDHSLYTDLIRGAEALCTYLDVRGLYPQLELHLGRAIQAAESLGDEAAQASLLCKLGLALIHAGKLTTAEQNLQEGLQLAHQEGTAALLLGYLGLAAYFRCDYDQMEKYLLEALPLARRARQDETLCRLLEGLSEAAQRRGNYAAAEVYCREGLALAHRLENQELISLLLKDLGNALFEKGGDYAEVSAYLQESLTAARDLGHLRIICTSLLSLGHVSCEHGDYELAEAYLHEALQLMHETDFPMERTFILCTLGLTALGREMYVQAADYLCEGLALSRRLGMAVLIAPIQNAWGWLHFKQKAWDAAAEAFGEALEISQQTGVRVQIAQALWGLAHLDMVVGNFAAAHQHGNESLTILETIGHRSQAEVRVWLSEALAQNVPEVHEPDKAEGTECDHGVMDASR
jgi:tetratricopeptide (TPR) repeat protein/transcriptional regulator with XRE-family HTH domain